jgi:hypothetical protein
VNHHVVAIANAIAALEEMAQVGRDLCQYGVPLRKQVDVMGTINFAEVCARELKIVHDEMTSSTGSVGSKGDL